MLVGCIAPVDAARKFDLRPVNNTLRRFRSAVDTILTAYTAKINVTWLHVE
jgi:hypothetical protein